MSNYLSTGKGESGQKSQSAASSDSNTTSTADTQTTKPKRKVHYGAFFKTEDLNVFTYFNIIMMSNFLKRQTTTTVPKRKFPTLAEIKEETDPIPEEVNSILFHNSIQYCVSKLTSCFLYVRFQTN